MAQAARKPQPSAWQTELDKALADLDQRKDDWARTSNAQRIEILRRIKDDTFAVAER